MTERISHEEALAAAADGGQGTYAVLRRYIRQQQALEADTVSRAEQYWPDWLPRVGDMVRMLDMPTAGPVRVVELRGGWRCLLDDGSEYRRDCHVSNLTLEPSDIPRAEPGSMQQRLATMTQNNATLNGQLTALQAELTTERARADELSLKLTRQANAHHSELAAATARAGRLEEALAELLGWVKPAWIAAEQALSAAPQASTEQASPSPAVGEDDWSKVEAGPFNAPEDSLAAQPAPGGTERWVPKAGNKARVIGATEDVSVLRVGDNGMVCVGDASPDSDGNRLTAWVSVDSLGPPRDPTPAEPQGRPDISECPKCGGTYTDEHEGPLCPPCDYVKEQGRPEQAGEYVTRAELVEALRSVNYTPFADVAERLEGK